MPKYTENDLMSAFDMPVDSKYQVHTQTRPTTPIATQTIQNLQAQPVDADVATRASSHLANLSQNLPAEVDDEEIGGYSDEEPEETNALMQAPGTEIGELSPSNWFSVAELPGNVQSQIRQLGRTLFKDITTTPISDVAVMSTLSNPEQQVQRTYAGILRDGEKVRDMEFDFSPVMPGYTAEGEVWRVEDPQSSAAGYEFLLIKDFAGHYVYGYPSTASKVYIKDETPVTAYLESLVYTGLAPRSQESKFKGWAC